MISAKIIADSKTEFGDRITSMVLTFPRHILAELNTHRVFSKNSASSRAIPFDRMLKKVLTEPFIPIAWQRDHKGMQGTEYITDVQTVDYLKKQWLFARDCAVDAAQRVASNDVTKQVTNRLLEPFLWHTVILTSTEWDNFFELRCPKYEITTPEEVKVFKSRKDVEKFTMGATFINGTTGQVRIPDELDWLLMNKGQAEIHMMALAEAMWDARNESTPALLGLNDWHIPFGDIIDEERVTNELYRLSGEKRLINRTDIEQAKLEIATARCARVSYQNYEGKDDYEADFRLFKTLKDSKHLSPFEHCAKAMTRDEMDNYFKVEDNFTDLGWCRNFKGFIQMRALMKQ